MANQSNDEFYDSKRTEISPAGLLRYFYSQRELIFLLVARDLKSRYRRSILGLLWTLINPIISSLILWVVFVSIFKSKLNNGTQFAPYLVAGVLTITFFNQGLMQVAESVSNGASLFLKVKVRPQIFALAGALSNAVNFFFGVIALLIVSIVSKAKIAISLPLVIVVALALILLTTGLGLMVGNLFILFDDSKYIITILLQLLTYLTPVFYPKEALNHTVRIIVSMNPLTSYLEILRYVVNGTEVVTRFDWGYMLGSSFLIFAIGLHIFQKAWPKTVAML